MGLLGGRGGPFFLSSVGFGGLGREGAAGLLFVAEGGEGRAGYFLIVAGLRL